MEQDGIRQLLFIYNARSGLGNALLDGAHKLFSPATYECRLCELTFGLVEERKQWKKFRKGSSISMKFLHKDEFLAEYASKFRPKYTFPLVLADTGEELEVFLSAPELNAMKDTDELIRAIASRS